MDFFKLLQSRRSIRDFEDKEVPVSVIEEMIHDACYAPSASNLQPWGFVIVRDRKVMKRLSDASKAELLNEIQRYPLDHPMKSYELHLKDKSFNVFYNAPCLVFITGPADRSSVEIDCALAAAYFMLSAAARGLGTCWIGLGSHISDPELLGELAVPENHRIVAPIIVGYPKSIPEPLEREEPQIFKVI
jgi:nitroreductase